MVVPIPLTLVLLAAVNVGSANDLASIVRVCSHFDNNAVAVVALGVLLESNVVAVGEGQPDYKKLKKPFLMSGGKKMDCSTGEKRNFNHQKVNKAKGLKLIKVGKPFAKKSSPMAASSNIAKGSCVTYCKLKMIRKNDGSGNAVAPLFNICPDDNILAATVKVTKKKKKTCLSIPKFPSQRQMGKMQYLSYIIGAPLICNGKYVGVTTVSRECGQNHMAVKAIKLK